MHKLNNLNDKELSDIDMNELDAEFNPANKINGIAATTAFEPVHVLNGHQTGILLQQNIADITFPGKMTITMKRASKYA